jgi:hypothetical protein
MTETSMIGAVEVTFVEPDGTRRPGAIGLGKPYLVDDIEARCPVRLEGLHPEIAYVAGADALQCVLLAARLVGSLLQSFIDRGGAVLVDDGEGAEVDFPLDSYFGTDPTRPSSG